jgi:hypothetical protein
VSVHDYQQWQVSMHSMDKTTITQVQPQADLEKVQKNLGAACVHARLRNKIMSFFAGHVSTLVCTLHLTFCHAAEIEMLECAENSQKYASSHVSICKICTAMSTEMNNTLSNLN